MEALLSNMFQKNNEKNPILKHHLLPSSLTILIQSTQEDFKSRVGFLLRFSFFFSFYFNIFLFQFGVDECYLREHNNLCLWVLTISILTMPAAVHTVEQSAVELGHLFESLG